MRSSPERLNLKPRLARPSEKKTKKRQSEQKGRWKAIQLCLKDIARSDQLRTKRKGNCKSVYLYEKVHILCIQWNTHLSKRGDGGFNSPFSTVKATISVRTLHHQVHQEKKNECNICYALGQNQPWFKFIFLLPRNGKDYQNEFFTKEKYNWDQCHFASSAESLTQTSIFLPRTDCGLIEGKLNTDNIIRSISFNVITNQKKFLFSEIPSLMQI